MYRFILSRALLLIIAAVVFVPAQTPTSNFNRTRTFDALHYEIRTTFDRKNRSIAGQTTVAFRPLVSGLASLELDSVGLTYNSVTLEPSSKPLRYRTIDGKIVVALDRGYASTETIRVKLAYTSRPKKGIRFVGSDFDGGQMIHDAQVWTQGQAEYSRYWFPSYDFPDDKATTEQYLTVNPGETAIANGSLADVSLNPDGTSTFHFKMDLPHSVYLTSFIIGKYVRQSDKYGEVPMSVYVYPGREPLFKNAFGRTKDMMRIFESLTGVPFAWPKYDQTIVAKFTLGGMENVTATTFSDAEIFTVDYNQLLVEDIVAHELAHSWFGNLVTCRNWAELWLNEGFATFMEAAYREKMYGRDEYLRKIRDDSEVYFAGESVMSKKHGLFNRLADGGDAQFDEVTYQKGGVVIHMLRETVGDQAFWKAIRIYLDRHRFGNVETTDLQKAFEDASGRKLDAFFGQWVYGSGYPKLEIAPRYDAKNGNLILNINQTQRADGLTPSAFQFPLEVAITTPTGTKTERIEIKDRVGVFALPLASAPINVAFDPNLKMPLVSVKTLSLKQ